MRDFGAAIGLVFAIEGLLLAGFTDTMRSRMAEVARLDPKRLRWFGLGRVIGIPVSLWITGVVVIASIVLARDTPRACELNAVHIRETAHVIRQNIASKLGHEPKKRVRKATRGETP